MNKTEYEQHMNGLASRIGKVLHGESMLNVASACAAVIGYSLSKMSDDEMREQVLGKLVEFIRQIYHTDDAGDDEAEYGKH